jgi:hypothetical protein
LRETSIEFHTLSNLKISDWIPLDADRHRHFSNPWFFGRFRANGWTAACE